MPKRIRINTANEVRRFVVMKLNQWEAGEIDNATLKTAVYAGQVLKSIVEASDLEDRIVALEEQFRMEVRQ